MKYFVRNVKGPDGTEFVSIYARVRHYPIDKKLPVGLHILPSEWEAYSNGTYNPTDWMSSINVSYSHFQNILEQIETFLETSFNPLTAASDIRKILEQNVFVPVSDSVIRYGDKYFSVFLQKYTMDAKNGKILKQGRATPVTKGYVNDIVHFYNKFTQYEKENGRVTFDEMDMTFHRKYIRWCNARNYSQNVIANDFGSMCRILRLAFFNKLTNNDIFKNPDFVPARVITNAVYLTVEQIEEMRNYDLHSQESISRFKEIWMRENNLCEHQFLYLDNMIDTMERARDIFIAGCLTGQRVSDYTRYSNDMIVVAGNIKFLKIKQVKTQKTVMIPLDKRVCHILDKYNGKMPDMCDNTLNSYLHIICEIMGWTWTPRIDNLHRTPKGRYRFCDLVTSHTARRSFATNAYNAGIPLSSIIAITGHSREEGLRRYLKLNAAEKALTASQEMQDFLQSPPP